MKKDNKYEPNIIEKKWQKKWSSSKLYKSREDSKKEKFYVLDMFPYPSGEGLHVGHPKGYIATDIVSRFERMKGKMVLHPMGFDAFGLPAENYALKTKTNPDIAVKKNVVRFKKQLEIIGLDYDWSREVNTTDPKYYKWTQWIFLQLFKKGLAYESFEPINWCPSCKTGLANEDIEDGRCERCGTPVEKKPMRQWVLKITDYAERLLNDLDAVDNIAKPLLNWPESIKELQRNWIGKSEGALIKFKIDGTNNFKQREIEVFTTRPDTLYGVTYLVLAPEHKSIESFLQFVGNRKEIEEYISKASKETEIDRTDATKEKTGVELKGVFAINPANNEKIPVWIADYVLADYGTGAVMAVPAHDERDWDFAKKYDLPRKQVIAVYQTTKEGKDKVRFDKDTIRRKTVYALLFDEKNDRFLCLDWERFGWHSGIIGGVEDNESYKEAAIREIQEETGYLNIEYVRDLGMEQHNHYFAAHKDVNRYAFGQGMLFRLINEEKNEIQEEHTTHHKPIWIRKDDMDSWLNLSAFKFMWDAYVSGNNYFTGNGKMINSGKFNDKDSEFIKKEITISVGGQWVTKYKLRDWVFSRQRYWGEPIPMIHCEKCGVVPVPEKDLPVKLPKVKSYEPTGTGESPLASITKWVNVKCPVCKGKAKRETNTMPQWAGSSWYYLRYEDVKNKKQLVDPKREKYWSPVDLYIGGAEHATRHLIYARFWHKFLYDIGIVSTIEPFKKLQSVGLIMGEDGRKMSKRFGNVVNPDNIVSSYGADSLRVYEMFMGPFNQQISWNTQSMIGIRRFLERIWKMQEKVKTTQKEQRDNTEVQKDNKLNECERLLHKTIKKVTEDISSLQFNTAISALMIVCNEIEKLDNVPKEYFEIILQLLAPFAPHISEELWSKIGNKYSIHLSAWPRYDENMLVNNEITVVVQVNGKVRGSFISNADESDEALKKNAMDMPEIKKWLNNGTAKKIIVVKTMNGKLLSIVV